MEADDVDHAKHRKGRGLGTVLWTGIPVGRQVVMQQQHRGRVHNGQKWGHASGQGIFETAPHWVHAILYILLPHRTQLHFGLI